MASTQKILFPVAAGKAETEQWWLEEIWELSCLKYGKSDWMERAKDVFALSDADMFSLKRIHSERMLFGG